MSNSFGFMGIREDDCELIEVCEHYNNVFKVCEKGSMIGSDRCSPAEKMVIKLLVSIDNKLSEVLEKLEK